MGNQDRPPPGVERLEPRLTLSTLRPLRQRAGVAGDHAEHLGVATETPEPSTAPLRARSVDHEAEGDPSDDSPAPTPGLSVFRRPGFRPLTGSDASEHGASGLHDATSPLPGPIAFAADHDPGHFVLVPISQVNAVPYPSPAAGPMAHDAGPSMAMGPGMPPAVSVGMAMDHRATAMPRMAPTRDVRPVVPHADLDAATMDAADELHDAPRAHELDPGLDPELSPGTDVELAPAMVLRDAPSFDVGVDRADPLPAPGGEAHGAGPAARVDDASAAPHAAAVLGTALVFRRNLVLGRPAADEEEEEPGSPAGVATTLLVRACRLLGRPWRVLRRRGVGPPTGA